MAWHAIHFLLTKSAWEGEEPLKSAVFGHTEFGEDLGYGPPKYIKKEMVKEIWKRCGGCEQERRRIPDMNRVKVKLSKPW